MTKFILNGWYKLISDSHHLATIHFVNSMVHREDGPAWIAAYGSEREFYYLYDQIIEDVSSELEFYIKSRKFKKTKHLFKLPELFSERLTSLYKLEPVDEI